MGKRFLTISFTFILLTIILWSNSQLQTVSARAIVPVDKLGINAKHNWQEEWQFESKKIPPYINYLKQTGVRYMRQSIHWNQLQPQKNTPVENWNWEKIDLLLSEAVKSGMEPVLVWVTPPRWASNAPAGEDIADYLVRPNKVDAYKNLCVS